MNKNIIIVFLSLLLVGACVALNHLTRRIDAAIKYINAFEETYPDYLDTVAEGDAYSEWYNYY